MPWLIRKEGDKYCVFREGADGEPEGSSRGCHDSQAQAEEQRRALYANVEEKSNGFMVWKEAHTGLYRWFSYYSNNYRDDDNPPEIISAKSQRTFVDMVDKGIVPYPELWLWHVPVVWGKADWLDFANGFALASGHVYPGFEHVAENLAKQKSLATSHGMPGHLQLRDPDDKSVINFHITGEISPLPRLAAANKRTGFVVLKGDDQMPLNADKRAWLTEVAKLDESFIKQLEDHLDGVAKEAAASGVESKETTVVVTETPASTIVPTPTPSPTPVPTPVAAVEADAPVPTPVAEEGKEKAATQYATVPEVAAVISEVMRPIMETLTAQSAQLAAVTKELSELKRTDAEKIAAVKEATPPLSLKELVAQNLIGNPAAKLGESDPLHGDKPKEAAPPAGYGPTIVPFLNGLVTSAAQAK